MVIRYTSRQFSDPFEPSEYLGLFEWPWPTFCTLLFPFGISEWFCSVSPSDRVFFLYCTWNSKVVSLGLTEWIGFLVIIFLTSIRSYRVKSTQSVRSDSTVFAPGLFWLYKLHLTLDWDDLNIKVGHFDKMKIFHVETFVILVHLNCVFGHAKILSQ